MMIEVSDIQDIDIEKGDFYSRQHVQEGESYNVVVVKKQFLEQFDDCLEEVADDGFGIVPDEPRHWILGMICDAALRKEGAAQVYQVNPPSPESGE